MDDFQRFTEGARAGRWRRPLVYLPLAVVAVLVVALGAWGAFAPTTLLGYEADARAEVPRVGKTSGPGWVQNLLAGGSPLSDGPVNVLVLGVDTRPQNEEMGTRTDTIMLVQLDPENDEIKLLSVPRDLLVEIEPGKKDRINAAYAYGGIEQSVSALQSYAEVPIDRYAIVDFEGFEDVINAMGKVEVDVEGEFPQKWHMEEGLQKLNGHRALLYARYRGTPGGDLDRIERQQQLVAALRSKALDWNIVTKLPEIMRVMNRNVETNLGFQEALSLGRALISQGRNAQMTTVQLEGTPHTLPSGAQVLLPNEVANEAILEEFRY